MVDSMVQKRSLVMILCTVLFLVLMISPILSADNPILLAHDPTTEWDSNWKFKQEINPYIQTASPQAKYQAIDTPIEFKKKCWAINETIHSIRVCSWDGAKWKELESQIYNLNFTDEHIVSDCSIIFLIPSYADGKERYYVYYHDTETNAPDYPNHVDIKDEFYFYEPITGIAVEGDYYEIIDDDEIVYGVGQKGNVMNRKLSQIAIRMKPGTKTFDILNSDLLTSFSFSYQDGPDDEDEVASDQKLIAKEITIHGNLMIEFALITESSNGLLRTSNIYRYYHSPSENKSIHVHVKHEIFDDLIVRGMENADGRYGTIISYHSKSESLNKMKFGDILPYLHVYGEDDRIKEYNMVTNPESSEREWVISYDENCDLGSSAWFSYSEGSQGKTHGIIISSNENIVSNASEERDGIQLKVSAKEYLDIIGAEIDYASISFGRNSYESLQPHDLSIQKGLTVEFDAEFITFQQGSYDDVHKESEFFQTLVKFRSVNANESFGNQHIHTLTVIPHLAGRIGSFPLLANRTSLPLPVLVAELYYNDELISSQVVQKPLFGFQIAKFSKLALGEYVIKLYRYYGEITRKFVGISQVELTGDKTLHIYCTWEKVIDVDVADQHNNPLPNVSLYLYQDSLLVSHLTSNNYGNTSFHVPFNLFQPYDVDMIINASFQDRFKLSNSYKFEAFYKGFQVSEEQISFAKKQIDFTVPIYDVIVEVSDELGLAPDVNVNPFMISDEMKNPIEIIPEYLGSGRYLFKDIPKATYNLHISYGGYIKTKTVDVPSSGEIISIRFAYISELSTELLTIRGEPFLDNTIDISIKRFGHIIYDKIPSDEKVKIPPGKYTVNVYDEDVLIGSKSIQLSHDSTLSIVTTKSSLIEWAVILSALFMIGPCLILALFRKISLNTCLKLFVLGLVFLSIVQPWWQFHGSADEQGFEKTSMMYLFPQIMIEEFKEDNYRYLTIATIPEMFTDFLFMLLVIIIIGISLMLISFIPNIILKKRFSLVLTILSIVFVVVVAMLFSMGMSRITEISLGSLNGSGMIDVVLPSEQTMYMQAYWGFGTGFYLVVLAATISLGAGLIDFIRNQRKKYLKKKQ